MPLSSGRLLRQGPAGRHSGKSEWSFPHAKLDGLCFHLSQYGKTRTFNVTVVLLFQSVVPLELPQVKPKRKDDGKGLGMQLKGPLAPGGRGPISELRSSTSGCPGSLGKDSPRPAPSGASQKPNSLLQSAADHLEEELDLLLNLDASVKEGDDILPEEMSQDLKSEKDGQVAQEEQGMAFHCSHAFSPFGCFCRSLPPPP